MDLFINLAHDSETPPVVEQVIVAYTFDRIKTWLVASGNVFTDKRPYFILPLKAVA
jgi:ribosome-binding ATPase YchF (GTP1/OBG family)